MRKHASKLVELLKADDTYLGIIRSVWPITPERPAHLLPQMIFLIEAIDAMTGMQGKPGDLAERTKAKLGISGSPLDRRRTVCSESPGDASEAMAGAFYSDGGLGRFYRCRKATSRPTKPMMTPATAAMKIHLLYQKV